MINDPAYRRFNFTYDIYPRVFPLGKEIALTVEADSAENAFTGEYTVTVFTVHDRSERNSLAVTASEDGKLRFAYTFRDEQEYAVSVKKGEANIAELYVYAVNDDLVGRYPYMGDLHVHSSYSDGSHNFKEVVSYYTKYGYDFFALTDHGRYYPSIEARDWAKENNIDVKIFPGEEIHLPATGTHIVGFGSRFSVNGLFEESPQLGDNRDERDPSEYSTWDGGEYYPSMTKEEIIAAADEYAAKLDNIPDNVPKRDIGACNWIFDKVREGGGVSIFAHPYWRIRVGYHIPMPTTEYMLKEHRFDAFELVGGEVYFDMNGLQLLQYYQLLAEGYDYPVVGSSDSHWVLGDERNTLIARTLLLSRSLEWADVKEAILSPEHYSIPVDLRPLDYNVAAPFRLSLYASYLIKNYFPIHDRLASEIGDAAWACVRGEEDASGKCAEFCGKKEELLHKYFAF